MSIISYNNKEIAEQKKCTFSALQSGFTFIELVVVISIVSIISSVLIFNYGSFDANIRLENLAQDIALRIKEAQTVAISGTYAKDYSYDFQYENSAAPDPAGQAPSYGIYFNTTDFAITSDIPHDKIFAFFADRPFHYVDSGTIPSYDASAIDHILTPPPIRGELCDPSTMGQAYEECLSVTQITSQDHISSISYKQDGGTITPITEDLGITFTRPWPTAQFANTGASGVSTLPPDIQEVYIEIQSLRDRTKHKYVLINRTGQISVKNGCAPVSGNPDPTCIVTP